MHSDKYIERFLFIDSVGQSVSPSDSVQGCVEGPEGEGGDYGGHKMRGTVYNFSCIIFMFTQFLKSIHSSICCCDFTHSLACFHLTFVGQVETHGPGAGGVPLTTLHSPPAPGPAPPPGPAPVPSPGPAPASAPALGQAPAPGQAPPPTPLWETE